MRSWDCFDTLIARRFFTPQSIWDALGQKLNDPRFKEKRINAKRKSKTKEFHDMYSYMEYDQQLEIDMEFEHCFPIVENMKRVEDGDIIVSDMYLSAEIILELLRKNGLDKDVGVFSSLDGKHKGWIWHTFKSKPTLHTGDNHHADVIVPGQLGIKTQFCQLHKFTSTEEWVSHRDYRLACFMRFIRLHCPYSVGTNEYHLWLDQANHNIPLLVLACFELPKEDVFFTYRDCEYLLPIFQKLTGGKGVRFDSSRVLYSKGMNSKYGDYVKSLGITQNSTIVDIFGSGLSLTSFFENECPNIKLIGHGANAIEKASSTSICGLGVVDIERHNTPSQGTCIDYDGKNFIREPNEHNPIIPKIQREAVQFAINNIDKFSFSKNKDIMIYLLKGMEHNFTGKYVPVYKCNDKNRAKVRIEGKF